MPEHRNHEREQTPTEEIQDFENAPTMPQVKTWSGGDEQGNPERAQDIKETVNRLLILNALLQTRSVTKAAHKVGLSQSAVSHALGRLRELFADELLVRTRRMELTPRAWDLAPRVREVVAEIERLMVADAPEEHLIANARPIPPCVDVELMSKRIDSLCGSWDDSAVADLFGVDMELIVSVRHRHKPDLERVDLFLLVCKLATTTGASVDWILGWTDVIVRRAPLAA